MWEEKMTTRAKTNLKIAQPEIEQMEAVMQEAHRDRIDLAVKELESERFELLSRRDLVRRQAEAVEQGLSMHIADIEATMRLYEAGLNSLATPSE